MKVRRIDHIGVIVNDLAAARDFFVAFGLVEHGEAQMEGALLEHPSVVECAVVGVPDDDRGTIIKAFVVLKPGYTGDQVIAQALQDFVKHTIAPYKYPRLIEFCERLPRADTGKRQRYKLRQQGQSTI